jgi:sialidase-1
MKTTFRFPVMLLCVMAVLVIAGGICTGVAQAESCAAKVVSAQKPFFDVQKPEVFNLTGKESGFLPSIMVAMDGSVIISVDDRPKGLIRAIRSEDGGKTWSQPYVIGPTVKIPGDTFDDGRYTKDLYGRSSNGSPVVDEVSGDIMLITSNLLPSDVMYRSKDHGKTWKAEKTKIHPDVNGWLSSTSSTSEAGITLRYGKHKGRLVIPTRVFWEYVNKGKNRQFYNKHYSSLIYSDDHGRNWHHGEPFPEKCTGESGLVELSNGSIYYNSRISGRTGNKSIAWSKDGGESWSESYVSKYLQDGPGDMYGCKSGLVRLRYDDKDIVIFSTPKNQKGKRDNPEDVRTVVHVSFDGAKTWPVSRELPIEFGGYSWMSVGRNGTPSEGMIYLMTWDKVLARFNLAWITENTSSDISAVKVKSPL